jgi:glycosyltransferase involved in cell wall biosynthesis
MVSTPSSARVSRPRSQPSAAEAATTSAGTRIQASTSVEGDLRFTGRECSLPSIMGAERKLPPVTGPGRIDTEFAALQLASDRLTPTSPEPLISFVVPAYNEAQSLEDVLQRVYALPLRAEVIAVDDGSTDRTAEILEQFAESQGLIAIRHDRNRGKGASVRTGLARSTGEVVVIQDADMEYDPAEVPTLIEPIERGVADVVFGSRLLGGRPQRAYLFWHLVGNRFLSLLTNVLYNTTLSDMETGYKAFRADALRSLRLTQDGFGIEPELTGEVCGRRLRVYQTPIAYYGRTYAEGKKITWRDGVKAVLVLVQVRLRR